MVEVNSRLEAGSCTYATLLLVNHGMCLNTPTQQFFKDGPVRFGRIWLL